MDKWINGKHSQQLDIALKQWINGSELKAERNPQKINKKLIKKIGNPQKTDPQSSDEPLNQIFCFPDSNQIKPSTSFHVRPRFI